MNFEEFKKCVKWLVKWYLIIQFAVIIIGGIAFVIGFFTLSNLLIPDTNKYENENDYHLNQHQIRYLEEKNHHFQNSHVNAR